MGVSYKTAVAGALIALSLVMTAANAPAAVYKYKKDGVWHFTDNPGEVPPDQLPEGAAAPPAPTASGTDLRQQLTAALRPANDIERATLATVAVQSSFGHGTGFFVSTDGLIITNRHVIRMGGGTHAADISSSFSQAQANLERFAGRLKQEDERLARAREELDEYRRYIDLQPPSPTKDLHKERYASRQEQYQQWERDLAEKRRELDAARDHLEESMVQRQVETSLADLNRNFTVFLADNTQLYAYVVEISEEHDLALLKIDGYVTPYIEAGQPYALAQGDPLYAIGNPAQLRNSVASGVLSGFSGPFIKTNAQIYPGNSGGPLVNANGQVVGINTFKKLTHKFEGLGFAISITAAKQTFDAF